MYALQSKNLATVPEVYIAKRRNLRKKSNGTMSIVFADLMNLLLCFILLRMSSMQEAQGRQDFPSTTSAISFTNPKDTPTQAFVIGYSNNTYYLDLEEVSKEQVISKLIEKTNGDFENPLIIITAARNADYGGVTDLITLCRTAGFKKVGLK